MGKRELTFFHSLIARPVFLIVLVVLQLALLAGVFAVLFHTFGGVFTQIQATGLGEAREEQSVESYGLLYSIIIAAAWKLGLLLASIFLFAEGVLVFIGRKILGLSLVWRGIPQYGTLFVIGEIIVGLGVAHFFSISLTENNTSFLSILIISVGLFVLFVAEILSFQKSWRSFVSILYTVGLKRVYLLLFLFVGVLIAALGALIILSLAVDFGFVVLVLTTLAFAIILVVLRLFAMDCASRWVGRYA